MNDRTQTSSTRAAPFRPLRALLWPYAASLVVVDDLPERFWLNTRHVMPNKSPLFFGGVEVRKAYVSFHLMPVYVFPKLLDPVSAALRKRMQGKSCFNFTRVDPALFQELGRLIAVGHKRFVQAGYVSSTSTA